MTRAGLLYVASLVGHGALALGVVSLKGARVREEVAISVVERKKAKPKDEAPPPPPPPADVRPVKAKAAAAPKPAVAPAAAATPGPAAADFGLSLGGGGPGGIAVPAARAAAPPGDAAPERVSKKTLAAAPKIDADCADPPKKPKVVSIVQPSYTAAAREAQIAGKVRIELTVDTAGKVSAARVLDGLGHGLDEAALEAARAATFEPGTRCGKPAPATFVVAIRFAL